ncbi:MAG: PA14 domain-containing protein [Verrucomicrobia bacterium]|nr:PA14 domain-containing protein [Verrucomicrobiota bacterium]
MEGYLTPTESGDYDFFLRSDDASRLEISTDDKEANLVWQAEEYGCCAAFLEPNDAGKPTVTTSMPISLVANRRYFIRVIYKEGGGGDYAQVAWRKVGDPTPAGSLQPIPGKYLSAAVDLPAPAEGAFITQTPAPNARGRYARPDHHHRPPGRHGSVDGRERLPQAQRCGGDADLHQGRQRGDDHLQTCWVPAQQVDAGGDFGLPESRGPAGDARVVV